MKTLIGYQWSSASSGSNAASPLYWDSQKLVNPHMLIFGGSGMGKTVLLRKLVTGVSDKSVRFHVFDLHGDMSMPGESVVEFSEQSLYGLNPLIINPDPRFGGVRKCIESFIRTMNQVSGIKGMGYKQEAVIRNLLEDVFAKFGFHMDDPSTWTLNTLDRRLVSGGNGYRLYLDVPINEKDEAKAFDARWDAAEKLWYTTADKYEGGITRWKPAIRLRSYPSIQDVVTYCDQLYRERLLGTDQAALRALGDLQKRAKSFHRKRLEALKDGYRDPTAVPDNESLDEARENVVEAMTNFVNKVVTGDELETMLKYDKPDVLKGVYDRLVAMMRSGVFSAKPPQFDEGSYIWRYKLDALFEEEKKMLVLFQLHQLFRDAVQSGEQPEVRTIAILDELGALTSSEDDKGDGIIGKIAREARKFGLGLWGAHQQLTGIPEGLMTSVGTTVIIGISETYWPQAISKLRIEQKQLSFIQPHRTLCAQFKEKGALKLNWRWMQHNAHLNG